jgi:hypothetical protein
MGTRINPDAVSYPPYDGGCIGICLHLDAHVPTPYDGGVPGVGPAPNPDAGAHDAGQPTPYDGGFFGVRINPEG